MKNKRLLTFIMAIVMFSSFVMMTGAFSYFSAYAISCRKGYFNQNYTLSGNMAEDVATIAKSQKGRTGTQFGYTEAWCDEFVADCLENAGADSSIVGHGGTVADFESVMRNKGAVQVSSPQTGDLVFFTYSHVEIVTKVENGVVYCAGGNNGGTGNYKTNNCAGERKLYASARLYLRPNYPNPKPVHYDPEGYLDTAEGGYGTVTLTGWALDRDTPNEACEIHIYMDGPAGEGTCIATGIMADQESPDIESVTGIGGNHRFKVTLNLDVTGNHSFYAYAINRGGGIHNPQLDSCLSTYIYEKTIIGDINNDGEMTIADAVILQKWLLSTPDVELVNWKSADLCEDNRIDVFDMIEMRKLIVNK